MLGAINPLAFGPFSDPTGDFMMQLVDVHPRAVPDQIRINVGEQCGHATAGSVTATELALSLREGVTPR